MGNPEQGSFNPEESNEIKNDKPAVKKNGVKVFKNGTEAHKKLNLKLEDITEVSDGETESEPVVEKQSFGDWASDLSAIAKLKQTETEERKKSARKDFDNLFKPKS